MENNSTSDHIPITSTFTSRIPPPKPKLPPLMIAPRTLDAAKLAKKLQWSNWPFIQANRVKYILSDLRKVKSQNCRLSDTIKILKQMDTDTPFQEYWERVEKLPKFNIVDLIESLSVVYDIGSKIIQIIVF